MIKDILKTSPGGEKIASEYARTKSLSNSRRRDMEQYAKGIISLFPNLADPKNKLGYEHYYNAEDGSGFLAWRLKTLQKEASEGRMKRPRQSQTGGPTAERYPCKGDSLLNDELQCQEAIALMKHTADEAVVKEKMRLTLAYRQKLLHDPKESTDILSIFPRFQDIPGLRHVVNSDSGSPFATFKSSKRPGKIITIQACDSLVKFIKTGTSIQGHLDGIGESLQPYLLVGPKKRRIQSWFIVIDQHALHKHKFKLYP
ncbi:uncharacterized protein LOC124395493 [Tachysurus ichikawai]